MDRTSEDNGLSNKRSRRPSNNAIRRVTAPLKLLAGGLQADPKQSKQRAQVRRLTTVLSTAAVFAHEIANPLQVCLPL